MTPEFTQNVGNLQNVRDIPGFWTDSWRSISGNIGEIQLTQNFCLDFRCCTVYRLVTAKINQSSLSLVVMWTIWQLEAALFGQQNQGRSQEFATRGGGKERVCGTADGSPPDRSRRQMLISSYDAPMSPSAMPLDITKMSEHRIITNRLFSCKHRFKLTLC